MTRSIIYVFCLIFNLFILIGCSKKTEPTIVVPKNNDVYLPSKIRPILDEWQQKTFRYFTDGASPTGMALEGNNRNDGGIITTGGSGFGVMALIVGIERGWISRQEAATQTQKIVRFLGKAERFKGTWSHWYNEDGTSHPFGDQVKTGDLVETSFMMAGLLAAKEYYTSDNEAEKEIRDSVDNFWHTIDWKFYTNNQNVLKWLWYSKENRFSLDIQGWNEALITYILALAAPVPHNISSEVYQNGWKRNGSYYNPTQKNYGYQLPLGENYGGPLFFSHYSFLGLNPKEIADNQIDFWQQNTAHTLINRHYCINQANKQYKYNESNWGLTACYGTNPPQSTYMARSPKKDDGVIAPTAALSAYPYTPFYSTQVLLNLAKFPLLHGKYGFADAYSPGTSRVEKRHLAIDQGPIVIMIENYRSGLIWDLLMRNQHIQKGLKLAEIAKPTYQQGFIRIMPEAVSKQYDMMRHPDRGKYEIDYYVNDAGKVTFSIKDSEGKAILNETVNASLGENTYAFDNIDIIKGKAYTLSFTTSNNTTYPINVRLR